MSQYDMFAYRPSAQEQDDAYARQLHRYSMTPDGQREQFERGLVQQEQNRRDTETKKKYGILGGLLGGGGGYTAKGWYGNRGG